MAETKVKTTVKKLIIKHDDVTLGFEFEVSSESIKKIDAFLNGIFDIAKAELLILREEIIKELMGEDPHLPV